MQNFNQKPINNQTTQTTLQLESKQVGENQNQEMRDEKMMSLWVGDGLLVKKNTYKTCGNCDAVNAEADKQCRVCGNCLQCVE